MITCLHSSRLAFSCERTKKNSCERTKSKSTRYRISSGLSVNVNARDSINVPNSFAVETNL